jgi:DNA-binding MarR family transcriptional regulator
MTDRRRYDDIPVLSLMRDARDVYREAVGRALADAGCDDVPRNGVLAIAGLGPGVAQAKFSPQADLVASLGLSKQAASQLIDTLVLREYLERRVDPDDRRRMGVRLTARGITAAAAIQTAVDTIEATLTQLITASQLRGFRAALAAFRAIREQLE